MRPPYRDQRPRLYLFTMTAGLKKDDLTGDRQTDRQTDKQTNRLTVTLEPRQQV